MLRSALFNLFFFASTFVLALWGVPLRCFAPDRIPGLVCCWAKLEIGAARWLCGIRFAVSGREHIRPGGALIASQHQSTFDTLVWFVLLPGCAYVAKRELTRIPLFGPLIRPAGLIVVDRGAGASALRGLLRDARRVLGEGRPVVIFPEGSRAEPGRPLPIQPGIVALAAASGQAVVPVLTDSGRFWGRRAFRKRSGTIRIEVRPPLAPNLSRDALTGALQELFESHSQPVENTVERTASGFGDSPSGKLEPIE